MRNQPFRSGTCTVVGFILLIAVTVSADEIGSLEEPSAHPLDRIRAYATSKHDFVKKNARDYTCQIVKRERVDGKMQNLQFMKAKVRSAQTQDSIEKPFAVQLVFQGPARVKGRVVQYVDGEYDDGMLVRLRPRGVTLRFALDNPVALKESAIPITHLGFEAVLEDIVTHIDQEIAADPKGANTIVKILKGVKINKRPSTAVRIIHPERAEGLEYHIATIFIDGEWQMPTRYETYDWPQEEGAKAQLMAEYTYVNLEVNVDIPDSDFEVLSLSKSEGQESTARSSTKTTVE